MTELVQAYQNGVMKASTHIEGTLVTSEDGMKFKGWPFVSVAELLHQKLEPYVDSQPSSAEPDGDNQAIISGRFPQVLMKLYMSDSPMVLAVALENQILASIGELDIYTEWYGYSEYSIEGYSVENFTIGNHDIESILKAHEGKYAHIVIEMY